MFTKEVLFVHKICDFSEESPVYTGKSGKTGQRTADKRKKKQSGAAESSSAQSDFTRNDAYRILPSPPMRAVSSSMRSSGKGGRHRGRRAMLMSFMGLSSAATRLELKAPQRLQRWIMAHSPLFRTQTATGSMMPPQSAARSPGSMSTWRLERQLGQWLRCWLPVFSGVQRRPQTLQVNESVQGWVL